MLLTPIVIRMAVADIGTSRSGGGRAPGKCGASISSWAFDCVDGVGGVSKRFALHSTSHASGPMASIQSILFSQASYVDKKHQEEPPFEVDT